MKLLLTLIALILITACGDDGPNCPGDLNLPIEIAPYKNFYNIGDTIIVKSKFNKLIYDNKTDKFYDASDYKFSPNIELLAIDSAYAPYAGSQIDKFTDYLKLDSSDMNYVYVNNKTSIAGEYNIRNDSINFSIKLKFLKKGNFWIKISSLSSGDSRLQNNYQFNCRGRKIIFHLESPKDNNIQHMQKFRTTYPNDYYLEDSINRFYNHAGYCLEVR